MSSVMIRFLLAMGVGGNVYWGTGQNFNLAVAAFAFSTLVATVR